MVRPGTGYVPIPRFVYDSIPGTIFANPNVRDVYCALHSWAAWGDACTPDGRPLKRGEVLGARHAIAARLGLSEKTVRHALERLVSFGFLTPQICGANGGANKNAKKGQRKGQERGQVATIFFINDYGQEAHKKNSEGPREGPRERPEIGPSEGPYTKKEEEEKKKEGGHASGARVRPNRYGTKTLAEIRAEKASSRHNTQPA